MDKRKNIKIILLIVSLFIVMASVEILIRNLGKITNDFYEKKVEESKKEEIYNSDESIQIRQVEKFVNDVFEALKEQKYEVVYNLMPSTYKKCFFENDIENFKKYVENIIKTTDEYNIVKTVKKSGNFHVMVGITSGVDYTTYNLAVQTIENDNYNIMFGDIINLVDTNNMCLIKNNLKYDLDYYYEDSNFGIFIMKVSNLSNNTVNIGFRNAYVETVNGKKYDGMITESITLKEGESKIISIAYERLDYALANLIFTEVRNAQNDKITMGLNEIFVIDTE